MLEVYEIVCAAAFGVFIVIYVGAWLLNIITKEIELWRK